MSTDSSAQLQREPEQKLPISAFVITFNEEDRLGPCLESLTFCEDLVVVDSYSTDRTLEIAERYGARIFQRPWPGYREQKEFGLGCTKYEWVINIDADERVSDELRRSIVRVIQGSKQEAVGYYVNRVVFYLGRWWRLGGWYPEYRLRLFQKSKVKWGGEDPHERPEVDGATLRLEGELQHYTYRSMSDQFQRLQAHSTAAAKTDFQRGRRFSVTKLIFSPILRTCKFYILKKGYREGVAGLIVAIAEGYYTFMKYAKLWEFEFDAAERAKYEKRKTLS